MAIVGVFPRQRRACALPGGHRDISGGVGLVTIYLTPRKWLTSPAVSAIIQVTFVTSFFTGNSRTPSSVRLFAFTARLDLCYTIGMTNPLIHWMICDFAYWYGRKD
jgi:hypothetical protein